MIKTKQEWKIGDCLELLSNIHDKSIDLIVTDPPYNIDSQGKTNFEMVNNVRIFNEVNYNYPEFKFEILNTLSKKLRDNGSIVIFYDNKEVTSIWNKLKEYQLKPKQLIFWYKGKKGINPRHNFTSTIETAVWAVKGKNYTWNGGGASPNCFVEKSQELCYPPNNYHPNQKPIKLIEYIIEILSNENDIILDPYLGSGTTLEACMNLNRNCIGFEIDTQWEPIYRKRLCLDNVRFI